MTPGSKTDPEKKPEIILIVAMARNRVIGKDGALPWHLPEDLKRFRSLTMGHPIIMGRKTWDSIGRPLPGRRNIVVTRNANLHVEGVEMVDSVDAALELTANVDRVFIIGGEQIYRTVLPLADRLELTRIDAVVDGDAYFPELDDSSWMEMAQQPAHDPASGLSYQFVTLQRRR